CQTGATHKLQKKARSLHSTAKVAVIRSYTQRYPHSPGLANLGEHHANVFATMPGNMTDSPFRGVI
ncbi:MULTISPECIES: hypothetical protein, partial [unclassified Pantoea]|uniref:hypothetical protein n=1 Tax=unclassified Pantoea TaxID=2630326 RepID=UPI00226AF309